MHSTSTKQSVFTYGFIKIFKTRGTLNFKIIFVTFYGYTKNKSYSGIRNSETHAETQQ
jgi:hypothetical protein